MTNKNRTTLGLNNGDFVVWQKPNIILKDISLFTLLEQFEHAKRIA